MKYTVDYSGSYDGIFDLVSELRSTGVAVTWDPPDRARGNVLEEIVISLIANGTYEAIKAAVTKVKTRSSDQASIEVKDNSQEDNGSSESDEPLDEDS